MNTQMRYVEYLKSGFEIFKTNPLPSVVAMLLMCVPFLGFVVMVNYLAEVKRVRNGGSIEIGRLVCFDHVADKIAGPLIMVIGFMLFVIPGCMLFFVPSMLADRPGMSFLTAVKGSFAFSKQNLVPMVLLALLLSVAGGIGAIAFGLGILVTYPIAMAATFLAYDAHRASIESSAMQDGIELATS